MAPSHHYEKVRNDSEEFETQSEDSLVVSPKPTSKRRLCMNGLALTTAIAAFLVGLSTLVVVSRLADSIQSITGQTSGTSDGEVPNCGTTREEAISKGCTFNIMANAWLPIECFNANELSEALAPDTELAQLGGSGPFQWYADKNHTQPITLEEVSSYDTAYTIQAYHVAHCIYDWDITVRAMNRAERGESPVWVHSKVLDHMHIQHCLKVIAVQRKVWGTYIEGQADVTFGYGECVRLDKMTRARTMARR